MATNAYLERMNQLQQERVRDNFQSFERSTGLPIQRPQAPQQSPSGVPTGETPKPQEDEAYKDSQFYMNFQNFQQNDPRFGGVFDELTKLATGLRQQVQEGYMPPQIAQQRLRQFVADTSAHYQRNAKKFEKEDAEAEKQKQMMALMGALGQTAGQGQQQEEQEVPPEGMSEQQAMQQAQPQQPSQSPVPNPQGGM